MIGWVFGLLGVGAIVAPLALYIFAPAAAFVAWNVVKGVFDWLMTKSIPLLIAGLVLLSASGFLIWRWGIADHGRRVAEKTVAMRTVERDKARDELKSCQSNVDTLTASLERQNDAVDALKVDSDARTKRANEAVRRAQEQARGLQRKITRLENAKPSADVCTSARSLIVETLREDR